MAEEEFAKYFGLGEYGVQNPEMLKQQAQENLNPAAEARVARHLEDAAPLELPDYVNWIALGGVTDVKNQGGCGSWYVCSTVCALGRRYNPTLALTNLFAASLF